MDKKENSLHEMKLNPQPFSGILHGRKKVEFRLYDEKRQKVKEGDYILFTEISEEEEALLVRVVGIHRAENFARLNESLIQKGVLQPGEFEPVGMERYYEQEAIEQYGVVGLEIQNVRESYYSFDSIEAFADYYSHPLLVAGYNGRCEVLMKLLFGKGTSRAFSMKEIQDCMVCNTKCIDQRLHDDDSDWNTVYSVSKICWYYVLKQIIYGKVGMKDGKIYSVGCEEDDLDIFYLKELIQTCYANRDFGVRYVQKESALWEKFLDLDISEYEYGLNLLEHVTEENADIVCALLKYSSEMQLKVEEEHHFTYQDGVHSDEKKKEITGWNCYSMPFIEQASSGEIRKHMEYMKNYSAADTVAEWARWSAKMAVLMGRGMMFPHTVYKEIMNRRF